MCSILEATSSCSADVESGVHQIRTQVNACDDPFTFGIAVTSSNRSWRNYYVSSNPHDLRKIGTDYWPLLLHVYIDRHPGGQSNVKACIQSIKTDHWYCFVNDTLPESPSGMVCPQTSFSGATILTASVISIVCALVLLTLLGSLFIWHRRRQNSPGRSYFKRIPFLPGAIPYDVDSPDVSKRHSVISQRFSGCYTPGSPIYTPTKSLGNRTLAALSKSVMTSTTTLDETSDYLVRNCSSNSPPRSPEEVTSAESSV